VIDLDATSDADVMRLIGEIPQADLVLMMVRAGGQHDGGACDRHRVQ